MARTTPEQLEGMRARMNAGEVMQAEDRRSVVARASRIIDAMRGLWPNTHVNPQTLTDSFGTSSAPPEVPHFSWKGRTIGTDSFSINGSFGTFYASHWKDERPSDIANSAFYAGVLASKLGLVDVEDFHLDTDQDPDTNPVNPSEIPSAE